jgi:hypothetical protein
MNKKEHLIKSLSIAIEALENDTIYYDWCKQDSCNMGIVSQAVLGISVNDLKLKRASIFNNIPKDIDVTWKNAVKYGCPLTGKSNFQIINDLENAGLSKNDIVHLEYLDNPGILSQSEILKEFVDKKIEIGEEEVRVKDESNFFKRIIGATKIEKRPIYKTVRELDYPPSYYTNKSNLIKYLKAWVKILKGGSNLEENTKENLEAQLLIAISEENFEKATELQNRIISL